MNIRVLYNYILVRLGVRHILPAHFVNSKSVSECGEELVERDGCLVRVGVYERLKKANDFLPGDRTSSSSPLKNLFRCSHTAIFVSGS